MNGRGMPVTGMMPMVMPDVLEDLEHEHGEHADADERAEEVAREPGGSPGAPHHDGEQREQRPRAPTKPSSSPTDGEDEVGVLLGDEAALGLRARSKSPRPSIRPLAMACVDCCWL